MAGQGARCGVFFDMDGTLVDSEPLTDALILHLVEEHGLLAPAFPLSQFHGVTWKQVAATLSVEYPELADLSLVDRLQSGFHRSLLDEMPPLISGVRRAFANANRVCTTGVVSSSPRETIQAVLENTGLAAICSVLVGAEDVRHSKPDPECYLLAAERAAVDAGHSLVFEDSCAGVQAARAAGMYVVGVVGNRDADAAAKVLCAADLIIENYRELPSDFFGNLRYHR